MLNSPDIWCLIIYRLDRRKGQTGMKRFYDSLLEQLEELMGALEKTRQELDTTKLHLSSTQQSLHERDRHLNSLRQDRRKQLQEILEMKLVTTFHSTVRPPSAASVRSQFPLETSTFLSSWDGLRCRNKRGPFCFASEFSLSSFGGCPSFCCVTGFV